MTVVTMEMEPMNAEIDFSKAALLIIDMQRDFLEPDGFAAVLGNDISKAQRCIEPCYNALQAARKKGMFIVHTREGHRPDMSDVHPYKLNKCGLLKKNVIGESSHNGRILIRGEPGHDIIEKLYPKQPQEPILDKPGKGSFYATDLHTLLITKNIQTIFVCGVTSEVCVHTTIREGNDRGYHCIALSDACASYIDEFHDVAMRMISSQGGIFGSVSTTEKFIEALNK